MMQSLNIILVISGTFGVVAGAGLLLMPERMLREHNPLRQWLLERDLAALLNRYQRLEPSFYRHHHILGAAVIIGALALLALLGKLHSHVFAASAWSSILGVRLAMLSGWTLAILALIIGLYLVIRPSALKGIEAIANRWIEPFPANTRVGMPADKGINRLILRAPRRTGMLLLLAGIACLLSKF